MANPVRIVAPGGRFPTANQPFTAATPYDSFNGRRGFCLGGALSELIFAFDASYILNTSEPGAGNTVTIVSFYLENGAGTLSIPFTFNAGSSSAVIANGGRVLTDPLTEAAAMALGMPAFTQDSLWFYRIYGTVPAGGNAPIATIYRTSNTGNSFAIFNNGIDNSSGVGVLPTQVLSVPAAGVKNSGFGPSAILGRYKATNKKAIVTMGDSIADGLQDVTNPEPSRAGYGFIDRAMTDVTYVTDFIGNMHLSLPGDYTSAYVSFNTKRSYYLQYANVLICDYGTNDFNNAIVGGGSIGGQTLATQQANIQYIWSQARAAGVQKILQMPLGPRNTSTDLWATIVNQTHSRVNFVAGGVADQYNQWLLTQVGVLIDGVLDMSTIRDTDPWYFSVNGTSNYSAQDETHYSPVAQQRLAIPLRTQIRTLTVNDAPAGSGSGINSHSWIGIGIGI